MIKELFVSKHNFEHYILNDMNIWKYGSHDVKILQFQDDEYALIKQCGQFYEPLYYLFSRTEVILDTLSKAKCAVVLYLEGGMALTFDQIETIKRGDIFIIGSGEVMSKSPPMPPLTIRENNFKPSSLKELERLVLLRLTRLGHRFGDDFYFTYSAISKVMPDFPIAYLKTAMKILRDKGFVQYMNGLSCDDGFMRGSGHKITKAGAAYLLAYMKGGSR